MQRLIFPVLAALLVACVPKPKQDYTVEQLAQLDSLKELMRVQAATADPLFAKRKQSTFTEGEFQAMYRGALRLRATSTSLRDRFGKKFQTRFAGFASQLLDGATALENAAASKLEQRASAALESMRQACAGCHRAFK
jgi:hypothetical protein